jgi:hypothetical protein
MNRKTNLYVAHFGIVFGGVVAGFAGHHTPDCYNHAFHTYGLMISALSTA